jgi:nitrate reductase gamma subunit
MPLGKQITFQIVNMGKPLNKKVNSPQLQTHQMHVMLCMMVTLCFPFRQLIEYFNILTSH